MTFKKINENTIRCVLTEDDMEENDIGLEDFFSSNREKIHNFLETIMDEARREIGYENDGSVLSMQLMPLPRNGLAITITGSSENDFKDMLGNVQGLFKDMKDRLGDGEQDLDDNETDSAQYDANDIQTVLCRLYIFDSLSDVESYCQAVCRYAKNLKTILYKNGEGEYYLQIFKGRASQAVLDYACAAACEYASVKEVSALFLKHMQEHFEKVIPKKVIELLGD